MLILLCPKEFASNGIIVEKLYATSRTPDGVRRCKDLEFQEEETNQSSAVKRFWLDLETTKSPLWRDYKEIVREYREHKALYTGQNLTAELTANTADNNGQHRTITNKRKAKTSLQTAPK